MRPTRLNHSLTGAESLGSDAWSAHVAAGGTKLGAITASPYVL